MRKTPLTLGVLSMVFGGIVAAYAALTLYLNASGSGQALVKRLQSMTAAMPQRAGSPDRAQLMARLEPVMKEVAPYTHSLIAGRLLLSLALVAIGYGLYKRQRWGRSGALAWSGLALLFLVADVIVNVGLIQPRVNAVMHELFASSASSPAAAAIMQTVGGAQTGLTILGALLFWAPFPCVLLALCGRRSAANDFID